MTIVYRIGTGLESLFRMILSSARRLIFAYDRIISRLKWRYLKPLQASTELFEVHLLIVKGAVYADVARICVESFLYHHPLAKISLHVDQNTRARCAKVFRRLIQKGRVILNFVDESAVQTWQEQKVNLLLSLNGTKQIFMDADLRWNAALENIPGFMFFLEEFDMEQKSPHRQLIQSVRSERPCGSMMRNTSFFSFGGHTLSEGEIYEVRKLHQEFDTFLGRANLGAEDLPLLSRLSEQISLSVLSENWAHQIFFLKDTDAPRDGQIAESTYFGTTGSRF